MGRPRLGFSNSPCATNVRTPFTWTFVVPTKLTAPIKFSKKQIWIPFISVFFFSGFDDRVMPQEPGSDNVDSSFTASKNSGRFWRNVPKLWSNIRTTFDLSWHKSFRPRVQVLKEKFWKGSSENLGDKKQRLTISFQFPAKEKERKLSKTSFKNFFSVSSSLPGSIF